MQKSSTVAPLGGGARDPRVPTINAKKYRWRAPLEVVLEIREHPPSTVGPLRGGDGDLGVPTINTKNIDGGPCGRWCRRSGSAHHQHKNINCGPHGRRCRSADHQYKIMSTTPP
jgi:hypothetical protein